jgi:hypothetical protein
MVRHRDYKREDKYEDTPTQVAHREERNLARAHETKKLGHKPSGDVGHKQPLSGSGHTSPGNVRIETVKQNRGWRKGQSGYKVPTEK